MRAMRRPTLLIAAFIINDMNVTTQARPWVSVIQAMAGYYGEPGPGLKPWDSCSGGQSGLSNTER